MNAKSNNTAGLKTAGLDDPEYVDPQLAAYEAEIRDNELKIAAMRRWITILTRDVQKAQISMQHYVALQSQGKRKPKTRIAPQRIARPARSKHWFCNETFKMLYLDQLAFPSPEKLNRICEEFLYPLVEGFVRSKIRGVVDEDEFIQRCVIRLLANLDMWDINKGTAFSYLNKAVKNQCLDILESMRSRSEREIPFSNLEVE